MKTQAELRTFVWGIMFGIFMWFAALLSISELAGVRWQPVKVGAAGYCNFDNPKGAAP